MASSLASQLQAISAKNTVVLDKRKRKSLHSVSLIFEPNVAAQQDYETIYSIGLEGLKDLELLDPKFHVFEKSLFAESSIDVDREVQTSEQNELLDKAVFNFLTLVAPRLQLQPAIKALEWLVRRFQYVFLHVLSLFSSSQ